MSHHDSHSGKAHTVLLVDDEPHVLAGLKRSLHHEPYRIVTAESGRESLEIMATEKVDLIIADQEMPEMVGTELLRRVAIKYPDAVRFMLTGKATLEVAIEAINSGEISRFFTKPADELDLKFSIRQALRQKDLMIEAQRLLRVAKMQSAALDQLEAHHPEIISIIREISHDELAGFNIDRLIDEIRRELSRTKELPWLREDQKDD